MCRHQALIDRAGNFLDVAPEAGAQAVCRIFPSGAKVKAMRTGFARFDGRR